MADKPHMPNNGTVYPYRQLGMGDLPGEKWKDIAGFEDYYMVSDLGRVKSLDRTIPHPRIGSQRVKGRMLFQSVSENRNLKTGEPSVYLQVSLAKEGKTYYYNTRRLVYLAFVDGSLDYAKDKLCVINTDCNGYDSRASNLGLATNREKGRRVILRGRMDSYLKTADRSKWRPNPGPMARRRPIDQHDPHTGRKIASFESITAAVQATGFGEKEIIRSAKGKRGNYRGYVWKYA